MRIIYGLVGLMALGSASLVAAQNVTPQNGTSAFGGLLGSIIQSAQKAEARAKWEKLDHATRVCAATYMSAKQVNFDAVVNGGISPEHPQLAPIVKFCGDLAAKQLKQNFGCTVNDSSGAPVSTMCDEAFAQNIDGKISRLTKEQFIRAVATGKKVLIANAETDTAKSARLAKAAQLAEEQRIAREQEAHKQAEAAEAEHKRFMESPEGKRQAAAALAEQHRAEVAKKAEAAAYAKKYPYTAKITCKMGDIYLLPQQCLTDRNQMNKVSVTVDGQQAWVDIRGERTGDGNAFETKLSQHFKISAQHNYDGRIPAVLKIAIVRNSDNKIVQQGSTASKFDTISLAN